MNKAELIKNECMKATEKDPIVLIRRIMHEDYISIHGPEHHILDGACFLTALHNNGVEFDLSAAIDELINRASRMPGATCGQWGMCGSSSSIGASLAIIHNTGPLSDNDYYKDNLLFVSRALNAIGTVGGPRCCKRNAFLSMKTAIQFVKERYGVELPNHQIECEFTDINQQCIKERCPFYKR